MSLFFTDYPRYFPEKEYEDAIKKIVEKLKKIPDVLSIYQIGNISNPGISDIDLFVVFKKDASCFLDPLRDLSRKERYLFPHNLYGIVYSYFRKAQHFTFFHNYNFLWGKEFSLSQDNLPGNEIYDLKVQTALEYLIKAYINISVELTYGIVKVRGLLFHAKALLYDFEFLGISSGNLFDLLKIIVDWRNSWFERRPSEKRLRNWINDYSDELFMFLEATLKTKKLFIPEWANLTIARNMILVPSRKFGYKHKGITLPSLLGSLGRRYFNIQHRWNKFEFFLPVISQSKSSILEKKFLFQREIKKNNTLFLPHFIPLASSLNVQ